MDILKTRKRRKKSIRKKVNGSADRPRMSIHKSNRALYVQIVNDIEGKTLCGTSTTMLEGDKAYSRKNLNFATILGERFAKIATEKGITKVVFDRSGYQYHGVVKAIAEAARKGGLQF